MVVTEKDQILGCQDDVVRQENRREKQRILIVDDSEMNRIILSEILQDEYDIIELPPAKSACVCWKNTEQALR